MQLNILQIYLNGLMKIFTFLELGQHYCMNRIIHFELIEIIVQMLHITFTRIYLNTHNNLMSWPGSNNTKVRYID
jgi:hypothetical protein